MPETQPAPWFSYRGHAPALALLAGMFAICIYLSQTGFTTLYEDDFGTALKARQFAETGRLSIHGFPLNPQIFQVLWGGLFSKLFGYSVPMLNYSGMVLGFVAVFFCYFAVFEITRSRDRAVFFAACFAVFPSCIGFAQRFMTEIPFAACIAAATYFFLRGRTGSMILCSLALGIAALIRHHAVFIALGFSLAIWLDTSQKDRRILRGFLPSLLPALFTGIFLLVMINSRPSGYFALLKNAGIVAANAGELAEIRSLISFYQSTYAMWNTVSYRIFFMVITPFFGFIIPWLCFWQRSDKPEALVRKSIRIAVAVSILALVATLAGLPDLLFESPGQRRSFIPALALNSKPVFYVLCVLAAAALVYFATHFTIRGRTARFVWISYLVYALAHVGWPVLYTNYIIPCLYPLFLVFLAEVTLPARLSAKAAVLFVGLCAAAGILFVRHQNMIDATLWSTGENYVQAHGKSHVLTGSLAWLGYHRFDDIEKRLGYASSNVSLWDDVLHKTPPQFVIARKINLKWYDNPFYFPRASEMDFAVLQGAPDTRKTYTTREIVSEIGIDNLFYHDTIVVVRKE